MLSNCQISLYKKHLSTHVQSEDNCAIFPVTNTQLFINYSAFHEGCKRKSQIRTLFSIIRNLMSKIYLYVWGLGLRVWGLGFGVLGFGVGVWGCGWWVGGFYVHTLVKNLLIKFLMMLFLVAKGCKFDSCAIIWWLMDQQTYYDDPNLQNIWCCILYFRLDVRPLKRIRRRLLSYLCHLRRLETSISLMMPVKSSVISLSSWNEDQLRQTRKGQWSVFFSEIFFTFFLFHPHNEFDPIAFNTYFITDWRPTQSEVLIISFLYISLFCLIVRYDALVFHPQFWVNFHHSTWVHDWLPFCMISSGVSSLRPYPGAANRFERLEWHAHSDLYPSPSYKRSYYISFW